MSSLISRLVDRFHYSVESIKNRYPCKLIKIKDIVNWKSQTRVTYRAVTKYNIRECSLKDMFDDPLLVEKFHPTDCMKLGFFAAGDILLKQNLTMEQAQALYTQITAKMIADINGEGNDAK